MRAGRRSAVGSAVALSTFGESLVVVAHPDDETFYFGGLILAELGPRADVVVVTDGDFAGRGAERLRRFGEAAGRLGARSAVSWGYADQRLFHLPVEEIEARLRALGGSGPYRSVFTHSPHGEYGHLQHMDVSLAVHRAFDGVLDVWSVADRLCVEHAVVLDRARFEAKAQVLTATYGDELRAVWPLAPLTGVEGFTRVGRDEAEAIHELCTTGEQPEPGRLKAYAHLREHLDRLVLRRP